MKPAACSFWMVGGPGGDSFQLWLADRYLRMKNVSFLSNKIHALICLKAAIVVGLLILTYCSETLSSHFMPVRRLFNIQSTCRKFSHCLHISTSNNTRFHFLSL